MCHKNKWIAMFIGIILFLPNNASAEASSVNSPSLAFETGVTLFQEHDYAHALIYFYKAKELGFDKPALSYNIGVCHYKLEQYREAKDAFSITAQAQKMAPLAFYNLALVAMASKNYEEALSWLSKVINGTNDIKLRSLALASMDHIKEIQKNKVFTYGSVGAGYDDNVILTAGSASASSSGKEDGFTEFTVFAGGPFPGGNHQNGLQFHAGGYILKYFDLSSYDASVVNLGSSYRKKLSAWHIEGGGKYAFTLLDGQKLEQVPSVDLTARYTFQSRGSIRFRYQLDYFDILAPDYDYLEGWRHRTNVIFIFPIDKTRLRFGYTLELNNRDDRESSPTRHQVQASIEYTIAPKLTLYSSAAYRKSSYDMGTSVDRSDDRYFGTGRLRFVPAQKWELSIEYRYTDNQSNLKEFDYQRNLFLLDIGRNF